MDVPLWQLIAAFVAGLVLGAGFFGGLWLTVRRVPRSAHPQRLVLLSFAARLAVTVAVVVLLAAVHWQLAAAAMAGVIVLRLCLVRLLRPHVGPVRRESGVSQP